jgi:hypothetical protein
MYKPDVDAPPPDIFSQSLLEKAGLVSRRGATEPHWPKEDPDDQPRPRWSLDRQDE